MDNRVPHYFTSVPDDRPPTQSNSPFKSKPHRPPMDQHQHRILIPDPPCQWSRAATTSPSAALHVSHRRFRIPSSDLMGSAAEDCGVIGFGSSATLQAAPSWLRRQPSAPPHHSLGSRLPASQEGSTAYDKRRNRRAHTPPGQPKTRRIHQREEEIGATGRMDNQRYPIDGAPSSGTSRDSAHARDGARVQATVEGFSSGLPYPVLVGHETRGSNAGTVVPRMGPSSHTPSENAPCRTGLTVPTHGDSVAHPYAKYRGPHLAATYSHVLPPENTVKLDPSGRGVEFTQSGPGKVLDHAGGNIVQRHHPYAPTKKEVQTMSRNNVMIDSVASTHPYLRGVDHPPTNQRQRRLSKDINVETAKDPTNFPIHMEPKIPQLVVGPKQGIERVVPNYDKLGHYHHSFSSSSLVSTRPLTSFQKFSTHVPHSMSKNGSHSKSFTGSSLGETYEFNRHVVSAFDLTTSRSALFWDVDRSKMYPEIQNQSDITNSLYAFSHITIPEPSNAEVIGSTWHMEKMNQPSPHSIPAQTSALSYETNLHIHAPSSSLCYSSTEEIQHDNTTTKTKLSMTKFIPPPISKPGNCLDSHTSALHNFGTSYNSPSGTSHQSHEPTMLESTTPRTATTSTVILSPNTGTSSLTTISRESEDCMENETHIDQADSSCLTSTKKKCNNSYCSSRFLPTEPHSKVEVHDLARSSQRGNDSRKSGKLMRQPNTQTNKFSECSSKSKPPTGGTRRKRRHAVGLICGVCGDSARSLHFGGVSCDSCKAFFRRAVIARAYPSFLCVTTGLPPNMKCQKGGMNATENSKSSDIPVERHSSLFKDPTQPDFTPTGNHKQVQSANNSGNAQKFSNSASISAIEDDKLNYNGSNICSNFKATTSATSTFEDGNSQPSFNVSSKKVSYCDPETPNQMQIDTNDLSEKHMNLNSSGSRQSQPGTRSKDAQHRLSPKIFVNCPPITITTRKHCQACRFQSCINIGMEISWVTLENDAQKIVSHQQMKSDFNRNECRPGNSSQKNEGPGGACDREHRETAKRGEADLNKFLTREERKQIEDLVDIYRSVFWGVPEPSYYRPALIDFPPPFAPSGPETEIIENMGSDYKTIKSSSCATHSEAGKSKYCTASVTTSNEISNAVTQPKPKRADSYYEVPVHSSDSNFSQDVLDSENNQQYLKSKPECQDIDSESDKTKPSPRADLYTGMPLSPDIEGENPVLGMSIEEIVKLPKDPCGVNMFRKVLVRRPRSWLIRQLMGYTLRFLTVVLKLLKSVGRSLSLTDRTILLRQGMTGLTFLNSVFTYDTDAEGWPERVFPPLPLVLQDEDSGCASDEPDYLQGIPMHPDEVASVVAPHVLEHQLTFIRGMKVLVGDDYTSMFLLIAIMLFDSAQEGLEQPEIVEKIQGNYCHLLKQYVGWKFRNGSPPNPGIGRPFNFTPLSSLPKNISNMGNFTITNENPVTENETLAGEGNKPLHSRGSSGTLEMNEKRKYPAGRNIFKFNRPDGMYYSPPYPPSPIKPSSIFPFLMSRMADLKEVAHGYSSAPFLLQGSEVDEIANLVARIEVFMSDIIATEPGRDFDDKGGSGGGVGGSGGNQDSKYDGVEPNTNRPGKDDCSRENTETRSPKQIFKSDTLHQDKISDNYDSGWDCQPEQDFKWDSYSSGDDSNSISSQNALSIGSSFDDIVEVLEADEREKLGNDLGCGQEEEFESLEIWEKDHSIPNFYETEEYLMNTCREDQAIDKKEEINTLDCHKSMFDAASKLTYEKSKVQPIKIVQDEFHLGDSISHEQHMKFTSQGEHDAAFQRHLIESKSFKEETDAWDMATHPTEVKSKVQVEVYPYKEMNSNVNLVHCESDSIEQNTLISGLEQSEDQIADKKYTSKWTITQNKDFHFIPSYDGVLDSCQNINTRQEDQNCSFWDRIKATGKALLGFDSSGSSIRQGGFWKGGSNVDGQTIQQEMDGELENWLNPLERPDSNSSGYVSAVSSPPSLLTVQREFDAYDSGGDWEDLFQNL